jgi:hypothetical protein
MNGIVFRGSPPIPKPIFTDSQLLRKYRISKEDNMDVNKIARIGNQLLNEEGDKRAAANANALAQKRRSSNRNSSSNRSLAFLKRFVSNFTGKKQPELVVEGFSNPNSPNSPKGGGYNSRKYKKPTVLAKKPKKPTVLAKKPKKPTVLAKKPKKVKAKK